MNLEEAKEFYLKYGGREFHMSREEPDKYREYRAFPVSQEMKREWNEELIANAIRNIRTYPDRASSFHFSVLEYLRRPGCNTEVWAGRLLDEMEKMPQLDKKNRILIIENMAGRSANMQEGGVWFYCACTSLGSRMNEIMERIMDFSCEDEPPRGLGWENMQKRLDKTCARYRKLYAEFSRGE